MEVAGRFHGMAAVDAQGVQCLGRPFEIALMEFESGRSSLLRSCSVQRPLE